MRRETLQSYLPLVAGLLLAIYGSAGVLGYGLHSLWGCGHCHHEASLECAPLSGDCSVLFSNHADKNPDHNQLLLAQEDCPICSFLLQAQSKFVLTTPNECVDSIPTIPPGEVSCYVAPLLGTHSGRGPPTC